MNSLIKAGKVRHIQWIIAATAVVLSLLFTFVLYPLVADSQHMDLDPDLHGPLGFAIWKLHTFSYYPSMEPASARGPFYPAVIAGLLALTNGWWPYAVQLFQCLIFGLLCLLVYWITRALWNGPAAVLASGLCAIHPFLIWYTSRIWIETLMIFLFTAMIGAIVYLTRRPTFARALLLGVILGLSALTKSIYAPFIIATPLLLLLSSWARRHMVIPFTVLISGILVVAPWVIRNGQTTGTYAPVVGASGFAIHQGNDFVEDFGLAPFSISKLFPLSIARMDSEHPSVPITLTGLRRENSIDSELGRIAMKKLQDTPEFLVKKVAYNMLLFWTLSDTPKKSLVVAMLQMPFVLLFAGFLCFPKRYLNNDALRTCLFVIVLLYLAHLPTIAVARYSVVLVPSMIIVVVGFLAPYLNETTISRKYSSPRAGTVMELE